MNIDEKKRIAGLVSPDELLKWTRELVAIPSYCGIEAQEKGVAEYIKRLFECEGIEARIAEIAGERYNVYGILHGTGGGKSLMLNGHMDTVPPYDMECACEPYMDGGMLHGRGTSDMKGPLAAMAGALIAIKRSGVKLKGDVIFAGVADEEQRSIGACDLIDSGIRADAVIVGEPLGPDSIAIAQKGLEWFEFKFTGKTVHGGAQDKGMNAILKAVKFIDAVQEKLLPELSKRTHPLLGRSTMNIGVIKGGTQLSTVAGECSVLLDRRFMPHSETYEGMCAELQAIIDGLAAEDADFKCEMRVTEDSVMKEGYVHQGMEQSPDDPFICTIKANLEAATGRKAELMGCPCWTDAGLLSYYGGMPTVIYGPGSLACSHSKEECISPSALPESCAVYVGTVLDYCG